jgi:hypothetical protein
MSSIAIMQPTFLPWIGYFDLIDQVDNFVFLDTVEFSKQSWQQRNKIKTSNGSLWLSLPVEYSKTQRTTLNEALIGDVRHLKKTITTVKNSYTKAKASESNLDWILAWLMQIQQGQQLSVLNINFINHICNKLMITTPRHLASEIPQSNSRHQRLIDICLHFGATKYVSPPGAFSYLQEDIGYFKNAGIDVSFHEYHHPIYNQIYDGFVSHMSIIDLILNEGTNALNILRKGRMQPKNYDDF